ncbi:MAG: endonuclease III [bacterium]
MDQKKRLLEIIKRLNKEYPHPRTALNYRTPFELLVATILSAQTTDAHVNKVTERLFKRYRTVKDYAAVPVETFQKDIGSINFYRNKAKHIVSTARMIVEKFHSEVPKTMEELTSLPGVARKTANIILWNVFGINEGIAVDTHVKRLANRLGLTAHEDPEKIEQDLMSITPRNEWGTITHLLILHGRKICQAKKPMHGDCVLFNICPSNNI